MKGLSLAYLLNKLRPFLLSIINIFVLTISSTLITLVLIPLSKDLTKVFSQESLKPLLNLAGFVIIIYFLKGVLSFYQNFLTGKMALNLTSEIRNDLYYKILLNDYDFLENNHTGDLTTTLTDDINKLRELILALVIELIPGIFMLICTISYVIYLNWRLSLLVFILIPLIGGFINYFSQKIRDSSSQVQNKVSNIYDKITENFTNFLAIKYLGIEKVSFHEFQIIEKEFLSTNLLVTKLIYLQPSIISVVQVTGIASIACFAGYEMISGRINLAELISFATALSLTIEPVIFITNSGGKIFRDWASLKRISDLALKISVNNPKVSDTKNIESDFSIKVKDLSYPKSNKPILKDLCFEIKSGEAIIISGDNGSGKSTLVKLLSGIYISYNGEIKLGNSNLKDLNNKVLRKVIRLSLHEPFIFGRSVKENIKLGNKNATDEELNLVYKLTQIEDLIELEKFEVGEFGNKLSSGQKQRISLARAIISKPNILILDEACSALDSASELEIYNSIRNYLTNTTIIIINHRKTHLSWINRTLELVNGGITQKEVFEY